MARLGDNEELVGLWRSESEAGVKMTGLYYLGEGMLKRLQPWRDVDSPPLFLLAPRAE